MPYLKSWVLLCRGSRVLLFTRGTWLGLCNKLVWVQLAHAEGHGVATTDLTAGRLGVNSQSRSRGSGWPVAQFCFGTQTVPLKPWVWFKRPKRVLFHREGLPAPVRIYWRYTIFIFPNGCVAITEEIWPDKSVHILVVLSTKWLGHTKAMSRRHNRPAGGAMIYLFCSFQSFWLFLWELTIEKTYLTMLYHNLGLKGILDVQTFQAR